MYHLKKIFRLYFCQLVHSKDARKQRLLYVLNPSKVRSCEYLVKTHVDRGDKVASLYIIVLHYIFQPTDYIFIHYLLFIILHHHMNRSLYLATT